MEAWPLRAQIINPDLRMVEVCGLSTCVSPAPKTKKIGVSSRPGICILPNMKSSAVATSVLKILQWRDRYRQEMRCQIVHDSLHSRDGWAQPYLLNLGDVIVGYGSVLVGGPWAGTRTIFEFYVAPEHRSRVFDLFSDLLSMSNATAVMAQTNDTLLSLMLHSWARDITSEKIVFEDKLTTALLLPGIIFRLASEADSPRIFPHRTEPIGDWVLDHEGEIEATGGILLHYNPPYGDLFMEVAEPFRNRGLGSYLVQELKRVCRERGYVPCARCDIKNLASRKTLQKAGFVPCATILSGSLRA